MKDDEVGNIHDVAVKCTVLVLVLLKPSIYRMLYISRVQCTYSNYCTKLSKHVILYTSTSICRVVEGIGDVCPIRRHVSRGYYFQTAYIFELRPRP